MTYAELQAQVAAHLHRGDLGTRIPEFIDAARQRINRRFDAELVELTGDSDTDAVLTDFSTLYLYAACEEGYIYLHNAEAASTYGQKWEKECDRHNVLQPGTALDQFGDVTPYVKLEDEV